MDDTQNTSPALTGDEIRKIAREEIVRFVDMILDNRNYSESLEQCIEWVAESLEGKDYTTHHEKRIPELEDRK